MSPLHSTKCPQIHPRLTRSVVDLQSIELALDRGGGGGASAQQPKSQPLHLGFAKHFPPSLFAFREANHCLLRSCSPCWVRSPSCFLSEDCQKGKAPYLFWVSSLIQGYRPSAMDALFNNHKIPTLPYFANACSSSCHGNGDRMSPPPRLAVMHNLNAYGRLWGSGCRLLSAE